MQIVRVMLIQTNNDTVTLAEKMLDDDAAWSEFERLAFELTGERKKKPIPVERRFPGEKP